MLNQNQFTLSTLKGTLDSGSSLTCQYHSADPADSVSAGEFVVLADVAAAVAPAVSVVQKGADKESKYLGMVLTNPLKASWVSGDKLEVAILGTIAIVEAGSALASGARLAYDPASPGVVSVAGAGDSVVGIAMEKATAAGQLVRCLVLTVV